MRTATDFIIEGRPQVVHHCFRSNFWTRNPAGHPKYQKTRIVAYFPIKLQQNTTI